MGSGIGTHQAVIANSHCKHAWFRFKESVDNRIEATSKAWMFNYLLLALQNAIINRRYGIVANAKSL